MYAMELYHSGSDKDFENAIPVFEKTLVEDGRSMDEVKEAMCVLARAYRIQKNLPKFFGFAIKDAVTTACAEVCCELGKYYEENGEPGEAVIWYQNAATETESILDIRTSQEIPREGLARCGVPMEAEGDESI